MTGRMDATILIAEDDPDVREIISLYLRREGGRIVAAEDGRRAMDLFRAESPDLVILDVMLPDMNGMEICRLIRETSTTPILFVSYRKDPAYILNGLELGGDDYVTKPFDPNILIARAKALLRRSRQSGPCKRMNLPHLQIDFISCEVRSGGETVRLSAKERQLLLLLAGHPNRVFSVAELYELVWGWDKNSGDWTVTVHIGNLRKKVEADPARPRYIRTVRGFGYKFAID